MKKFPRLLVSILTLSCPLSALAYGGYYADVIMQQLSILLVIFLIFLFVCLKHFKILKYFRIAIKNKKIFLITIAPLILAPLIFIIFFILGMTEEIKKVEEYKALYPSCGNSLPSPSSGLEQSGSLSRSCLALDFREPVFSSINLIINFLFLCYLLIIVYGVYYFKKINKSTGLSILKFSILIITIIVFIYISLIIMSTTILGI